MKQRIHILCLLLFFSWSVQAATEPVFHVVKGTVYDMTTRKPLMGVRVQAYGQNRYTTLTNEQGEFALEIPQQTVILSASFQDYNVVETAIRGREENIDILMIPDKFKSDIPASRYYSVEQTGTMEQTNAISADEELELTGKARSIHRSGTPGAGAAMFINGYHTLNNASQPLLVVDGIILENLEDKLPIHDGYYNNLLSAIDVEDIESITLLDKATSLYGSKGANGVLLVTTKRAHDMVTHINVAASVGVDMPAKNPTMMDADNFRLYASDLLGHRFGSGAQYTFLNDDPSKITYPKYHNNTNWQDYVFRNAITQKYSVNVSGGDQVAMYNLSVGYTGSQGVVDATDFARVNVRFNTDVNLFKNFYTRLDVSYSNTRRKLFDDGAPASYTDGPILSPAFLSLIKAPILSPYKYDIFGNLTTLEEDADDYGISLGANNSFANPLAIVSNGTGVNKNSQQYDLFAMSLEPRYDFTKHLSLVASAALNFSDETEKYFSPMTGTPVFYAEGKGVVENHAMSQFIRKTNLAINARLSWDKTWLSNSILLYGGVRYLNNSYNANMLEGYNTGSDKMPNITGSLQYRSTEGDKDTWRNLAYFAHAAWSWQGKYFAEGTVCLESSSKFGTEGNAGIGLFGVRWGVFPSLQLGWLVSAEKFMKPLTFVNSLKITAGIDVSGNDALDNYASRGYFEAVTFLGNTTGLQLTHIGNSAICWENTTRKHIGLDMSLFNNRLGLNVELFDDFTDQLVTLKDLNAVSGLDTYWSNDGSMRNRGYNITLNGKLIARNHFRWDLGLNIGHYRNEVVSLPDNKSVVTSIYGAEILTEVGQPVGLFYGYKTNGVFATSSQAAASGLVQRSAEGLATPFKAGDVIFSDLDNNKTINSSDKTVIGNPNPLLYGNIFTHIGWKNWTLGAYFKYSYGNDIYNYVRSQLEAGSMIFNQTTALQRRWVSEGQQTDIPRVEYGDPTGNSRFSDRWIEDGSYLKFKRLTLSYDLPLNKEFIQGLNVYASVENLFTLTSYLGSDPEFSMSNSVLCQGIDRGLTATGLGFQMGIKIRL